MSSFFVLRSHVQLMWVQIVGTVCGCPGFCVQIVNKMDAGVTDV